MMKEAHRVGVTPYLLRLAVYYAAKGLGAYAPDGDALYDGIVVRELMPWKMGDTLTESCMILSVDFYQGNERVRWVEFALTPAGFGGSPILTSAGLSDQSRSPHPSPPPKP